MHREIEDGEKTLVADEDHEEPIFSLLVTPPTEGDATISQAVGPQEQKIPIIIQEGDGHAAIPDHDSSSRKGKTHFWRKIMVYDLTRRLVKVCNEDSISKSALSLPPSIELRLAHKHLPSVFLDKEALQTLTLPAGLDSVTVFLDRTTGKPTLDQYPENEEDREGKLNWCLFNLHRWRMGRWAKMLRLCGVLDMEVLYLMERIPEGEVAG